MGSFFGHWLEMQSRMVNPPKMFLVNWFRKGQDGKFLWPGYGEDMRVLKWVVDRSRLRVGGQETAFGWVPKAGDLDLSGLDIPSDTVDEATHVDIDEWQTELESIGRVLQDGGTDACPRCSICTARSASSASRSSSRPSRPASTEMPAAAWPCARGASSLGRRVK